MSHKAMFKEEPKTPKEKLRDNILLTFIVVLFIVVCALNNLNNF